MNSPKEENQVIKEKDTVFRCKKVHVQSPSELVYKGIPRDREVYKFAWCLVRNVHELDKALER